MGTYLSKSTYLQGIRCHKCLWLDKHKSKLKPSLTEDEQKRILDGNKVGMLARQLFPGGIEIASNMSFGYESKVKSTFTSMNSGALVIYEASFIYDNVYCAVDILVRDGEKWKIFEVKSTTEIKAHYLDDVALQYFILQNCGIKISDASIVFLSNQYVRSGDIQPEQFFTVKSIFSEIKSTQENVGLATSVFKLILDSDKEPQQDIGMHCHTPDDCDFMEHCWKHIPENSVFDIAGFYKKRKFALYSRGIIRMEDVPDDFELADTQRTQIECYKSGKSVFVLDKIKSFLDRIIFPCYFFDIETFSPVIPMFDSSRPYQRISFQFSLHFQKNNNSEVKHFEFLAEPKGDPRRNFIRSFLSATETPGAIMVYNQGFEESVLKELAKDFPDYTAKIHERILRMIDLAEPFRKKHIYKPEMNGSYSIKEVLPAMVQGFSYSELEIQDGMTASNLYEKLFSEKDERKIHSTLKSLREYCSMDTLAMVKILESLNKNCSSACLSWAVRLQKKLTHRRVGEKK